jgi:hypothetical protein
VADTDSVTREYVEACDAGNLDRVVAVLHQDIELVETDALPGAVTCMS